MNPFRVAAEMPKVETEPFPRFSRVRHNRCGCSLRTPFRQCGGRARNRAPRYRSGPLSTTFFALSIFFAGIFSALAFVLPEIRSTSWVGFGHLVEFFVAALLTFCLGWHDRELVK